MDLLVLQSSASPPFSPSLMIVPAGGTPSLILPLSFFRRQSGFSACILPLPFSIRRRAIILFKSFKLHRSPNPLACTVCRCGTRKDDRKIQVIEIQVME